MKVRLFGAFSLLAFASILVTGCPGNSPTSPAAPTATFTFTDTPCMNAGGTPCTSTPTFTDTDTATDTATGTPTSTGTSTYTRTFTFTATDTATATSTGTPTSTPTVTDTPTITDTPTETLSPTPTGSDTATFTRTSTPSSTPTKTSTNTPVVPTNTATLCPTQSFTPTPLANGYSISGSVGFSGTGVNGSHPLQVVAFDTNGNNGNPYDLVTTNNSSYTIQGLSAGATYMVVAFFNPSVTGFSWPPALGSYAAMYGTSSCTVSLASPIIVSGAMTSKNVTIGTANLINGYGGTASYSGSLGRVDGCHGIIVELFPTGTTLYGASNSVTAVSSNNDAYVQTNGGSFTLVGGKGGGNACAGQTVNILAYYNAGTGGCCGIQSGDPYVFLQNQASGTSPSLTISLTDSQTY